MGNVVCGCVVIVRVGVRSGGYPSTISLVIVKSIINSFSCVSKGAQICQVTKMGYQKSGILV